MSKQNKSLPVVVGWNLTPTPVILFFQGVRNLELTLKEADVLCKQLRTTIKFLKDSKKEAKP